MVMVFQGRYLMENAYTARSIDEVVTSGLCIGCGLCESLTNGRVSMQLTSYGALRPAPLDDFKDHEEAHLLTVCPGVTVSPRKHDTMTVDPVWGAYCDMRYAWAANPDVRFKAATGGVLTALGAHLLSAGKVSFVLQVAADPDHPMLSRWLMNETAEDVHQSAGSRYAPTAPLSGFMEALAREVPFAVIAKPCDLNAVHNLSKSDPRVDRFCTHRLAMVCGGQSRLTKSQNLLSELGVADEDVTLFRHRGHGNPGPTRIETQEGRAFEKRYNELWENEAGWLLETRCKLCPDALGEAADVSAADVWPGGAPSGDDEGFNGIIVRSHAGQRLVEEAVNSADLVVGGQISPEEFNDFQPHQVTKKQALLSRFKGLADAGFPIISTQDLRLDVLNEELTQDEKDAASKGTTERALSGRFSEA